MRCPKCHYLSFEPDPRCKNCGYDLDVETDETEEAAELPDLPLRPVAMDSAHERVVTLELVKPAVPPPLPALQPVRQPETEPARVQEPALAFAGVAAEPAARRAPGKPSPPTTELPLFVKTMGPQELDAFAGLENEEDVEPVVPLPPSSRPLSVRRPVADPVRAAPRHERRPGPLDHDLLEDLQRLEREEAVRLPNGSMATDRSTGSEDDGAGVAMSQRFGAAAFDALLLGGIGAFVLWATLKVLDASPADLGAAALLPLAVFLAGVCIAYLLLFTAAGGQTVGKMLMGIRVIGDGGPEGDRVTLGQAAGRAILAPLSIAVLGLGWLPALIGRGPALHDRLAHTRVVRA
jgi:uncharacterized RDD family membrane protein YckC